MQKKEYQARIIKASIMLSITFLAIYSLKSILTDCSIFSLNECQDKNAEIQALEKSIASLKDEINLIETQFSELTCPVIETQVKRDPANIDINLWEQGNMEVLEGCWELDWEYEMIRVSTGETVGVSSWDVCFGDTGSIGTQNLSFEDGDRCINQPIFGEFQKVNESSTLFLDDRTDVKCINSFIYRRKLSCDLVQGGRHAMCSTSSLQRDGTWSQPSPNDVRLFKKN